MIETELQESYSWYKGIIEASRSYAVSRYSTPWQRRAAQIHANRLFYGWGARPKLSCLLKFIGAIYYLHFLGVKSLFHFKKISSFSIWDSDFEPHFSQEQIASYLEQSDLLESKNESVFLKFRNERFQSEKYIFFQRPLFQALLFVKCTAIDFLILSFSLHFNFLKFLWFSVRDKDFLHAWKDFVTEPLINLYKKRGLKKVFRTNSDFHSQEYWVDTVDFHTVWYSINSINFQYFKGRQLEHPLYYFCHFGTSLTWNDRHAQWLKTLFPAGEVKIKGPILFYSAGTQALPDRPKPSRVLIFDVTPFEEAIIRERVFRRGFHYYSEDTCTQFLDDVASAFLKKGWRVCLKPKRPFTSEHSKRYRDLIEQLRKDRNFTLLPPNSNNFDEIRESDVVFSIPFSSPFDIAQSLKTPAYYYDPSGLIDFSSMGFSSETFLNQPHQIERVVNEKR